MASLPTIEFLHTAEVHVATFEALLAGAPEARLRHEVRADWLDEARSTGLTPALRETVADHLRAAAARSAVVVCTCSTLGPIADDVGRHHGAVFRIDRPMMEEAVRIGGSCIVALCLESTIEPTTTLLEDVGRALDRPVTYEIARCLEAWPHFEAGDTNAFAREIAARIRKTASGIGVLGSVVLAQASMACAESHLSDLGVPILSSPRLAAEEALRRVRSPHTPESR